MANGLYKYGIVCKATQANNTSDETFKKLLELVDDSDIREIKNDIETKKLKQNVMCILFEYICRKYTNDTITYHIGQDRLYTYSKILSILLILNIKFDI